MDPQLRMSLTIYGGVLPGVVAFLALFLFWGLHARRSTIREIESDDARVSDGPRWLIPLLIASGIIACDLVINAGAAWWPKSATERYIHAVVLIALFCAIEGAIRVPSPFVLVTRALGYGIAIWMLASPYADSGILGAGDLWGAIVLGGFGGSLLANHADAGLGSTSAWKSAIVPLISFGALMPILFAMGWAVGSMMLIGVLAVLTNIVIVGLIFRRMRLTRGGIGMLVGVLIVLLVGVGIQNEPESIPAIGAIGLLPLAFAIPGKDSLRTLLVRLISAGVLLATAGVILQSNADSDAYGDDGFGYDEYKEYSDD